MTNAHCPEDICTHLGRGLEAQSVLGVTKGHFFFHSKVIILHEAGVGYF